MFIHCLENPFPTVTKEKGVMKKRWEAKHGWPNGLGYHDQENIVVEMFDIMASELRKIR